jgi:hypothetical protein
MQPIHIMRIAAGKVLSFTSGPARMKPCKTLSHASGVCGPATRG